MYRTWPSAHSGGSSPPKKTAIEPLPAMNERSVWFSRNNSWLIEQVKCWQRHGEQCIAIKFHELAPNGTFFVSLIIVRAIYLDQRFVRRV